MNRDWTSKIWAYYGLLHPKTNQRGIYNQPAGGIWPPRNIKTRDMTWYDPKNQPCHGFLVRKNMVSWSIPSWWTHLHHPIWTHQICISNISVTCPSAKKPPAISVSIQSSHPGHPGDPVMESTQVTGPEIPRGSHKPSYHSKGVSDNHPF